MVVVGFAGFVIIGSADAIKTLFCSDAFFLLDSFLKIISNHSKFMAQ